MAGSPLALGLERPSVACIFRNESVLLHRHVLPEQSTAAEAERAGSGGQSSLDDPPRPEFDAYEILSNSPARAAISHVRHESQGPHDAPPQNHASALQPGVQAVDLVKDSANTDSSEVLADYISPEPRPDYLDGITTQWNKERPDLDVWPMDVIGRIRRLTSLLNKANEEVWSTFGLQGGLFDVLAALRRAGPPYRLSPTELYNSLLISSGAMTHRLSRLSSNGLIRRIPDATDGRSLLVELTDDGYAVIDAAVEAFLERGYSTLGALDESERQTLVDLLRTVLLSLGDDGAPESSRPV